jgi:electron transfer flavoprotein beta subunit
LLETDGREWDPQQTARAIVEAVENQRVSGTEFDLMLFGNEAADTGDYQVSVRVAHALGLPCVTGVKELELVDGRAIASRDAGSFWEVFEVELPAVVAVREGINLPRYPSVPGRLRAKKKPVDRVRVEQAPGGLEMLRLMIPPGAAKQAEILGRGPDAAPAVVGVLQQRGLV